MTKKILLAALIMLSIQNVWADGSTRERRTCLGGDRYQAWAQISKKLPYSQSNGSFYVYMQVGTDPFGRPVFQWVKQSTPPTNWSVVATDRNIGCTRPKHAYCTYNYQAPTYYPGNPNPNYVSASATSDVTYDWQGQHLRYISNHSSLKAGVSSETNVSECNDQPGLSEGTIDANVAMNEDYNGLIIENLTGNLKIETGSNFYATYHIIVVKENQNMTDVELAEVDEKAHNLQFDDVVSEGAITLNKSGATATGILENVQLNTYGDERNTVLSFGNFNKAVNLDRSALREGEEFTLYTYVDGGYDWAQTGTPAARKMMMLENEFEVYPNPACSSVNISLPSELAGHNIIISILDITGRTVQQIFNGVTQTSKMENIPVGNLSSGMYFISVSSEENNIVRKKLTINNK